MKFGILFFALATSFSSLASNHEKILKQIDALVAKDSYEEAFHCKDAATKEDYTCWGPNCETFVNYSEVVSCGSSATILHTSEDESEETIISKQDYQAAKGNPMRMIKKLKSFNEEQFELISSKAVKVNYLGLTRNALKIEGTAELCFEEEEIPEATTENCVQVPLTFVIVQGVPFIAKISSLNINAGDFIVNQNVVEFSRE